MCNGDGLRVVLWTAGCSHGCRDCHNPVTWDPSGGLLFDEAAKEEVFTELSKDYIAGITFSGGDPLFEGNKEAVTVLAQEIKVSFPEKTIWLYTGYLWEEIEKEEIVSYLDVIVDGKFEAEKQLQTLKWKGSENQRVIDVKASLETGQLVTHTEG